MRLLRALIGAPLLLAPSSVGRAQTFTQLQWGINIGALPSSAAALCVMNGAACRAQIGSLRGSVFNPGPWVGLRYADIPDTLCGSDMSTQIQAELNRLPAGGLLMLPGGCILIGGSTITSLNGQHMQGVGPQGTNANQGTQLATTATSGTAIRLQGSGASIRDVWFSNTPAAHTVTITNASPAVITWTGHGLIAGQLVQFTTTGALPTGLVVGTNYFVLAAGLTANAFEVSTTPGGSAVVTSSAGSGVQSATTTLATAIQLGIGDNTQPSFQKVENVRVEGFAKGIYVSDGQYYTIDHYMSDGAKIAGLHINNVNNGDFGDPSIANSYFTSDDTGILFSSGGGPKFSNVKIIGGRVGMDVAPGDGISTSDFKTGTTSIEGTTEHAVRVQRAGTTGVVYSVTIDAQIAHDGGNGVTIGPGANVVLIPASTIISSTGSGTAGHAVAISGGNGQSGGSVSTIAPTVSHSTLSAFSITAGKNYHFDIRNVGAVDNGILVEDTRGNIDIGNETNTYEYTLGPLTALTGSYQTLFSIKPGAFIGGYFDFSLEASSHLVGAVSHVSRWNYTNQGAASTLNLVSRMINATTIVDFSFDASAGDGTIAIQARLHSGGTAIDAGTATLVLRGRPATLTYGTAF